MDRGSEVIPYTSSAAGGTPVASKRRTPVATDAAGKRVATAERHTNGKKAALHLSIDAPNPATGTGSKLILDGHDAALLRCALDAAPAPGARAATRR